MKSVITIIFILLGCFSNCIQVDDCSGDKILSCRTHYSCKCALKINQLVQCVFICRGLNNSASLLLNSENDVNTTHSEREILGDVEITLSSLSEINASYTLNFETVKRLNLSYNGMSTIASDTFHSLADLKLLDLSHNNLTDLPDELLRYLTKLETLNLAANRIQHVSASFLKDLENLLVLNMSRNNLIEVPEDLFSSTHKLKVLSLAHNKLHALPDKIFRNLTELEILNLSYNELTRLQPSLFESQKSLRNLSISHNQIRSYEEKTFANIRKTLISVDMYGNPTDCGPSHFWLYLWMTNVTIFESSKILECFSSEEPKNRTFSRDYEIIRMTRSIEECDTCKKCNCSLKHEWLIVVVNCTNKNLGSVPQKLPIRTRKVFLDNNKITSFVIEEEYVDNWTDVSFIGLTNNLISSLEKSEELSLLNHIIAINLSGNKLKDIPLHLLDQLSPTLNELYLGDNPWLCNCHTIRFKMWLQDHYRIIKDIENIRCARDNSYTSNQVIYRMRKSELCPQPPKPLDYLDILNVTMGVLILLIISKVAYDYWHQKKTGKLPRFFGFNLP